MDVAPQSTEILSKILQGAWYLIPQFLKTVRYLIHNFFVLLLKKLLKLDFQIYLTIFLNIELDVIFASVLEFCLYLVQSIIPASLCLALLLILISG